LNSSEKEDFMGLDKYYYVKISENALIQLILNGLEAYSVSDLGKKNYKNQLETYGLLWGHEIQLPKNKGPLYYIDLISIDTSAKRGRNYCNYSDSALELKRDIMTSFWPHYDFLGDVHTHPYSNYKNVEDEKLYEFSKGDIKDLEGRCDHWKEHNYRVGLVLTIAGMLREGKKASKYLKNSLIEFTLGNYRLWIKSYVVFNEKSEENEDGRSELIVSGHNEEYVFLDCPALAPGIMTTFTSFGRVKGGHGVNHILGDI